MAQICNKKAVSLNPAGLREKKRLAGDAGLEVLAAASDVFKAAEMAEHDASPGAIDVYLSSAHVRLVQASALLGDVQALLNTGTTSPDMRDWLHRLDYERLYTDGRASGEIPANREMWTECVQVLLAEGAHGSCRALRDRINGTVALLADGRPLVMIQSAIIELTAYARHGS